MAAAVEGEPDVEAVAELIMCVKAYSCVIAASITNLSQYESLGIISI